MFSKTGKEFKKETVMFFIAGGCRDVELFELEWVTQKHFHYLTSKNTNHSRASVEGREMYSILYLDDRFCLQSLQIDHAIKM